MPKSRSPRVLIFMVLSSRDRKFVSVEIVWLGQSPGHRRLRFSFQFNDVKDRDWLSPAPLFCAGGRRRRLSIDRPRWCQPAISGFCDISEKPRIWPQKSPRAAQGLAPMVRSDSIEARENTHFEPNIKRFLAPLSEPV